MSGSLAAKGSATFTISSFHLHCCLMLLRGIIRARSLNTENSCLLYLGEREREKKVDKSGVSEPEHRSCFCCRAENNGRRDAATLCEGEELSQRPQHSVSLNTGFLFTSNYVFEDSWKRVKLTFSPRNGTERNRPYTNGTIGLSSLTIFSRAHRKAVKQVLMSSGHLSGRASLGRLRH